VNAEWIKGADFKYYLIYLFYCPFIFHVCICSKGVVLGIRGTFVLYGDTI
jgi:hypothetical protein